MLERFFEDFAPGQTFVSGRIVIDDQQVVDFATRFDPQPFHMDPDAARGTMFRGLAASGWHTAAITMRLLVESDLKPAGGWIGAGCDELRWPRPVRPGDTLRTESQALEMRPLKSRPDQGLVKMRTVTLNQMNEEVQIMVSNLLVQRRLPATQPEPSA